MEQTFFIVGSILGILSFVLNWVFMVYGTKTSNILCKWVKECEKEVANLKKEVAGLKKEIADIKGK